MIYKPINNGPEIVAIKLTTSLFTKLCPEIIIEPVCGFSTISPEGVIYLLWSLSPNIESIIDPRKPLNIIPKIKYFSIDIN